VETPLSARRLAVSVMPLENRRETLLAVATGADRRGYDGFFLPETWAFDVTVLLAEAAVATERIALGTGIVSVWSRSAGTLAMAAVTLAAISRGRFVLGLGASTAQLTEGLHDVPFAAPLARMRQVVIQVRALLEGQRVPLAAAPEARPLKLNVPPGPAPPIYLAALTDGSIRLAGELGDGWIPFLYPLGRLEDGAGLLDEGRARRGGGERATVICPSVPAVVSADPGQAREGAAWFAAFYLTAMGPLYRQSLARQGFGAEVEAVVAANTPRMRGVVPPAADRLLEELIVFGTPAEARSRLARWYAGGADMVSLLLRPGLTAEQIDFTLDAFRPLAAPAGGRT
jgi:alkanesulfonate monooxygenase SsuD/methylene tetrahydromethanopterin reductase-like flavin-dependent oxidoreductase (luciferase family)